MDWGYIYAGLMQSLRSIQAQMRWTWLKKYIAIISIPWHLEIVLFFYKWIKVDYVSKAEMIINVLVVDWVIIWLASKPFPYPPPPPAWDVWSLPGRVLHHLQASEARSPRYRSHPLFSFHPSEVDCFRCINKNGLSTHWTPLSLLGWNWKRKNKKHLLLDLSM